MASHLYVQTNDATGNELIAFRIAADGALEPLARFSTGGQGSGEPHLASQGSIAVSGDRRWLLVTNAGSADLSLFTVTPDGPRIADRVDVDGQAPTSVSVHGDLVYVLHNGSSSIEGFRLADDMLAPVPESTRHLSGGPTDPAQIAFTPNGDRLVVTERATNSISTFVVGPDGRASGPTTVRSSGDTPYGFGFTPTGSVIVSEAFGAAAGAAAASSYSLSSDAPAVTSPSVHSGRTEVCWVAVTGDGRFAYVTNFGDSTVSSYAIGDGGTLTLENAVAASARTGEKGLRDETLTVDGRFLYAIDPDATSIVGWAVGDDGGLSPVGSFGGVPATVAGLAAS